MDGLQDIVARLDPEQLEEFIDQLPPEAVTAIVEEMGMKHAATQVPATPIKMARELVPGFISRPHLRYLSKRITAAMKEVEQGGNPRIIVEMPPRSGKSLLATQITSAWALALHPNWPIMLTSYSSSLATSWSRTVRRWVAEGKVGDVELSQDSTRAEEWETTEGGTLLARSLGGQTTGRGAKLLVIDDPHKDFADAHSQASRDAAWNWWLSTSSSRLTPQSIVIIIMCMTGDTPVLRPDGSETPLRDIRIGDEIATYENGKLTTSKVMNWANQGPDNIYEIRLESGRTVRANARHPFLTLDPEDNETWKPTKELRPGEYILTVTGESGKESSATLKGATSPSTARECAHLTTTKQDGLRVTGPTHTTPEHAEQLELSTDTGLLSTNTKHSLSSNKDFVQSVKSYPMTAAQHTGQGSSALTTTTRREKCEDCCATTVTSCSNDTSNLSDSETPLNTLNITPDRIVSITPAGVEDVYDIQVDRTENFIANGLVSHNTRWHTDDLVGRLLSREYPGDPSDWEVIRLSAIAEKNDVLGREPGTPLLSPLDLNESIEMASKRWNRVKNDVGSYVWSSLYQQNPAPAEGTTLKVDWFRYWTTDPDLVEKDEFGDPKENGKTVLLDPDKLGTAEWTDSWDLTFKGSDTSDYVVGQRWAKVGANRFLIAQQRGRWSFSEVLRRMRDWAKRDDPAVSPYGHYVYQRIVERAANAEAAQDTLRDEIAGIKLVSARTSKENRARAVSPEIESGNVLLPHPAEPGMSWVGDMIAEIREFPNGAHDDQVDTMTQALAHLRDGGMTGIVMPGETSVQVPGTTPQRSRQQAVPGLSIPGGTLGGSSRLTAARSSGRRV